MMDVEGVEDDGDATIKSIATKTERLVFTWPIRYIKSFVHGLTFKCPRIVLFWNNFLCNDLIVANQRRKSMKSLAGI